MNLLISKDIKQYINNNESYLITFVYNGNIFTNNIEHLHSVTFNIINYIMNKLKHYEPKKEINKFKRDIYFSQIRDKNNKTEKIYSNYYNFIMEFNLHYKIYLIQTDYKTYDKQSFPNLNKYHYTSEIEQKIIKIENIELIIENNIVFIKFKNPNIDILCDIINVVDSYDTM